MATQTALDKQTHALVSLFLKLYNDRYGRQPRNFNRYRDKHGFKSMIEDLGVEDAQKVVRYYVSSNRPDHQSAYLLYNYDKLYAIVEERENDDRDREKIRQETKKRVEELERRGD